MIIVFTLCEPPDPLFDLRDESTLKNASLNANHMKIEHHIIQIHNLPLDIDV